MTTAANSIEAFPAERWAIADGTPAGWSADLLARAQAYSEQAGSSAVMIVQGGTVVAQWGDVARKSPVASIRKSLIGALYGIAIAEGKIGLRQMLAELGIDDNQPLTNAEKAATVADLLTTRSGVYHPVDSQPIGLAGELPPRGSHAPGTHFYYNNWDFNVLGTIYRQTTGEDIWKSFKTRIADAIGLEDYRIADGAWGPGEISRHRNYHFNVSARDLARFGLLYARRGVWRGRQIVPADWVAQSTRTHTQVRSRMFAGRGYGYMWWTGFGDDLAPTVTLPAGTFHALGIGSQYLFVDPAHDLVIVHTVDMSSGRWPEIDNKRIGRLVWLILSAAGIPDIGPDTALQSRRSVLEGAALQTALSGKTLRYGEDAADGPYFLTLAADGGLSLAKGAARQEADRGQWWIEDDRLFWRWSRQVPNTGAYRVGIDGTTVSLYQDHDTLYLQAQIEPGGP